MYPKKNKFLLFIYKEVEGQSPSKGIKELIEKFMPPSGSNRGYPAYCYIEPILIMLTGGGKTIEDFSVIKMDNALRKLTRMGKTPSTSTVGDWLRRHGNSLGSKIGLLNFLSAISGFT